MRKVNKCIIIKIIKRNYKSTYTPHKIKLAKYMPQHEDIKYNSLPRKTSGLLCVTGFGSSLKEVAFG